jgi:hypothetical protein
MHLARLLTLFAALLLCAPSHAQTIKSLGYNTTNGFVVYGGTNALTFTNSLQFATNARAGTRTNLGATTVGDSVFTATNAAAARTGLGLGDWAVLSDGSALRSEILTISDGEQLDYIQFTAGSGVSFFGNRASQFRTALGLGLPALTNTSNVTFRSAVGVAAAPIFKVLTNNFSITNQTNMTVVDGLTISTEAGKAYIFELFPIVSADAAGTSFQIVATNATVYGNWDSISAASYTITPLTNALNNITITTARVPNQKFHVVAGTNAGSIAFQFSSSVATNTNTIGEGSYMMAQEVAPTP